jgi:spore germination protein YaaH
MVMNGKPHPEPYRRAAEELRVDPLSCVAIEDSPTGVASAEAAGCVVVAVQHLVPIPAAPHRVRLSTLQGVTPEQLGEWVESTPPPERPIATAPGLYDFAADPSGELGGSGGPGAFDDVDGVDYGGAPPDRAPDRTAAALRFRPRGAGGLGALVAGRGRLIGAISAVVLVLLGGVWYFAVRDSGPKYDPGPFNVHTWAPYWELDRSADELGTRASAFHQVSPFWYDVTGIGSIVVNENADDDLVERFLDTARSRGIPIVASIFDQTDAGVMAGILADPAQRAAHIETVAAFAAANDFDGIDLDYENFAFEDDRSSWSSTRPNFTAFVAELSARLASDGRILVVTVPPIYDTEQTEDSGYWVYDYRAIAPHVNAIRIMAYDFSQRGGAPGPIAPLDWVETIVEAATDAADGPEKLVLGIPLYGYNWVVDTVGECPESADGSIAVSMARISEILETRNATEPVYDEDTGESTFTYQLDVNSEETSCTQTREVHYLSAEGVRTRMELSIERGMRGVSLYAFGFEDPVVFDQIAEINATLVTTTTLDATTVPTTLATTTTASAATTVTPTTAAPAVTTAPPTTSAAAAATTSSAPPST